MNNKTDNRSQATGHKSRLVSLGVITTPHGVRGQVKIRSFTANPENITAYGPLRSASGRQFTIVVTGGTQNALIASIEGISTREQAETLRNIELFIPRDALPKPKSNQYYHEDLVGLNVATESGEPYGAITAVHNFGAGDLLAITRGRGEEELMPFSRTTFPRIDIEAGIAVIVPPEKVDYQRLEPPLPPEE